MLSLRSTLITVIALLAGLPCPGAENPTDFTVASPVDDSRFVLSEHRGKVVALHFLLKTECPYCQRYTRAYAAEATATPGVVHVFLKPDSPKDILAWTAKFNQTELNTMPRIYRDPNARLAGQYGVPDGYAFHGQVVRFPAIVLLNEQGKEFFRYVGKNNSDRLPIEEFRKQLSEHQAAKPPAGK